MLVPCGPVGPPAPVNSGVRLFAHKIRPAKYDARISGVRLHSLRFSFNERNGPYVLTVYAMNEHGEYFMFRSNKPSPYIKHMTQTMAKVVLKDKYIRPSSAQVIQG
jgi:hypothetical protein